MFQSALFENVLISKIKKLVLHSLEVLSMGSCDDTGM